MSVPKILFLGFAIDNKKMEQIAAIDPNPQISAHKVMWNIIKGMETELGRSVDLISSLPVSDFPQYRKLLIPYKTWQHQTGATDFLIPFLNIFFAKQLSRFIFTIPIIAKWCATYKHHSPTVVIYSMHSPFIAAAQLIKKKIHSVKIVLIIPDLPLYTDANLSKKSIKKFAKSIDSKILQRLCQSMDGVIAFTKHQVADFGLSHIPHTIVECIIDKTQLPKIPKKIETTKSSEKVIFYAGGLSASYGLPLLMDAFQLIKDPEYRLAICGRGPMEKKIKSVANNDPRIIFHGFVPNQQVQQMERNATVLVTVRSTKSIFTRYSFPSKLSEYMMSGTPVLTTRMEGIPQEYDKYLIFLDDETPQGLAQLLKYTCDKPKSELYEFGQRACAYICKTKNHIVQGKKIVNFIRNL